MWDRSEAVDKDYLALGTFDIKYLDSKLYIPPIYSINSG